MQQHIVVVGGGAGGLELVCKLGRKYGAETVTLIDNALTHIWKPSLHEVAAGTLDIHQEGLSYQMLAHDDNFSFVYGAMIGLDIEGQNVIVSEVIGEDGAQILPERKIPYTQLVIAVGSTANYFGVPGAAEYSISLNTPHDAERFRLRMLKLLTYADLQKKDNPNAGVSIVIIGGGATGVELAAELREASSIQTQYGFKKLDSHNDVSITLLEGAPRILAPLPEKVSQAATQLLKERSINVYTHCQVTQIDSKGVTDKAGQIYPADIVVWAAGIKAPAFLATLGLPCNRNGLIEVTPQLQVKGQSNIFSLGDCAACEGPDGKLFPPRAQTAHQQADYLFAALSNILKGATPSTEPYHYKDYGSLVSMGTQTSVGSLMGNLFNASWFVEGLFARAMYVSLHLMHHQAVLGTLRTSLIAFARFLVKRTKPLVKLH